MKGKVGLSLRGQEPAGLLGGWPSLVLVSGTVASGGGALFEGEGSHREGTLFPSPCSYRGLSPDPSPGPSRAVVHTHHHLPFHTCTASIRVPV